MVKRAHKASDGMYHIKGKKYQKVKGSRAQVHNGTAYKTPGGLTKKALKMNKHGRIVSTKKSATAKKENRLGKAGYKTRKGVFGAFKDGKKVGKTRKRRRGSRRRR